MSSRRRVSNKSRRQKRVDRFIDKNLSNRELADLIWYKLEKIGKKLPLKIYLRMLVTDKIDDLRKIAALNSQKLAIFIDNQLEIEKVGLPIVFKPVKLSNVYKLIK